MGIAPELWEVTNQPGCEAPECDAGDGPPTVQSELCSGKKLQRGIQFGWGKRHTNQFLNQFLILPHQFLNQFQFLFFLDQFSFFFSKSVSNFF